MMRPVAPSITGEEAMELYTAGTGNGQRAAIAINECGVTCKIHVLNLAQGDQKKPDYLKINPTGRIPTLIDPQGPDGKPLTLIQSWAILIYLAEKTGKLRANRPLARARTFQWMTEGAATWRRPRRTSSFSAIGCPRRCRIRRSNSTRTASSPNSAPPTSSSPRRPI